MQSGSGYAAIKPEYVVRRDAKAEATEHKPKDDNNISNSEPSAPKKTKQDDSEVSNIEKSTDNSRENVDDGSKLSKRAQKRKFKGSFPTTDEKCKF